MPVDPSLSLGGAVRATAGAAYIHISVRANAPRTRIRGVKGDRILLEVNAPPERGRANTELLRYLRKSLGVDGSSVSIVSGRRERRKVVRVVGMEAEDVRARLSSLFPG